jgi:ABC-type dipeptide/oligopeptide/nickel transport system ATPase component
LAELLRVEDLRTWYHTPAGVIRAVDGVTFSLEQGRTLGLVGESGSGKSVTALSIMRLIDPPGRIEPNSRIVFQGTDLATASEEELQELRGNQVAMIFQEPMTSLNPVYPIGPQVAEPLRLHRTRRPPGGADTGRGAAPTSWHPATRTSGARVSAPAVRRYARAGDDRDGDGV